MFAIMSFQRVRRFRVLKFLWLDDSGWKVPLLTPLCTKANNVKKPVRYTSITQLDPVKRLFLDKIRVYSTKRQASGGLVDAGPEYENVFNEELTKLQRLYGGGDLSKFPEFKFSEPVLDESNSK
ncbi:ATP synthase-coupling factor 6, mitochondrial [Rhinichthys klamathensis goyatoka]|uniref:ATP synthase-coupling factor 6, mitochondrial n=1 Tax=Rhinichthys klamathensis goyatoka TaxID=3034132 RepID=UPI0024B5F4A0|nr:ATP synthase-coupling factor 6, mitochondrial [Rhinichthys klamathensis goyatoka]